MPFYLYYVPFNLQKNHRMHAAIYDDRSSRCSQRLISAKETQSLISSRKTMVQDFSESSSTGSRSDRDDEDSFYGYNYKRGRIPLSRQYQATVPEWTQQTYQHDTKWVGFPVWPLEKTELRSSLIELERIGKGRQDLCGCEIPGSLECVRFHISEKRNRTKLLTNFYSGSNSWTGPTNSIQSVLGLRGVM